MTAPLFLVAPGALDGLAAGASYVLDGPEGRHAATVRRLGAGEPVDLADGDGALVRGLVRGAGRDSLVVAVEAVERVPEPDLRLVLVQALAKGGRDEQAVESATEVGVDAVVPWQAARSVVVWKGERGEKARGKWADVARAAAKQARRPRVPVVEAPVTTAGLVRRAAAAAAVLVLHEGAAAPLTAVDLPPAGEVLVVVGPEGGVDATEIEALTGAGARAVVLGPTVLRSSTAGPAALAVLSARTGRW